MTTLRPTRIVESGVPAIDFILVHILRHKGQRGFGAQCPVEAEVQILLGVAGAKHASEVVAADVTIIL